MLIIPGGGYQKLQIDARVSDWVESLGMEPRVVEYPVGTRHPAPLEAARAALHDARADGVERVGMLGFSAGGHLSALCALTPPEHERPDLVILAQAVVSFELPTPLPYREILLGPSPTNEQLRSMSTDLLVSPEAPPFFLWHTVDDAVVPVEHAYRLARALSQAGVPHAAHVFTTGAHGIRMAEGQGEPSAWPDLCAQWLRARGWVD